MTDVNILLPFCLFFCFEIPFFLLCFLYNLLLCLVVCLPGESPGPGSLVGCHLWGRTESDTAKATSSSSSMLRFTSLYLCEFTVDWLCINHEAYIKDLIQKQSVFTWKQLNIQMHTRIIFYLSHVLLLWRNNRHHFILYVH